MEQEKFSAGKFDLATDTPKDFEIKISGVRSPGIYEGELYFLEPGQGNTAALQISIRVIADGSPKFAQRKGSESVMIQLVNCTSALGCRVARFLQPSAFSSSYPLQFNNGHIESFDVVATATGIGDVARRSLDGVISIVRSTTVPPDPVVTLPITIAQPAVALPDHYVGDVTLRLPDSATALQIPLEVNVRARPIPPITVLLLGVLLGQVVKYMKDKGTPQSDLLLQLSRLEYRISLSPDDEALLAPMLEDVKQMIVDGELDNAKTELTSIENRFSLLRNLRGLEQSLQPRKNESAVQQILGEIGRARTMIALKQNAQASALVTTIENEVVNLPPPAVGAEVSAVATMQARAAGALARTGTTAFVPAAPRSKKLNLAYLIEVWDNARAVVTLVLIRPGLYILLLFGLVFIGLLQLYLKNPTFGSNAVSDYFGLAVWAMSAEAASRTLSTLKS